MFALWCCLVINLRLTYTLIDIPGRGHLIDIPGRGHFL